MRRDAKKYLLAALACLAAAIIYECFGHGVYSLYMICTFMFPLLLGAAPAMALARRGRVPGAALRRLWGAGVWTLAAGSFMTGVFEIYGSPSPLTAAYWPAGGILLAVCAVMWAASEKRKKTGDF